MIQQKLLNIDDLRPFGKTGNFPEMAKTLVQQQKATWPLAKQNYEGLEKAETKVFDFGDFRIVAQFNPERIRSSAAKTDAKTIASRPCFLCLQNLPTEQKGFLLFEKYLVLANPYPIFPVHLTISDIKHTPQLINGRIADLLQISQALPCFTVFYNGPKCGASAPDHFHFQAGIKRFLPVEDEISNNSELIEDSEEIKIRFSKNYLRRYISIESGNKNLLEDRFNSVYLELEKRNQPVEPQMNILCNFSDGKWQLILFLRDKQRPCHFFFEGEKQIVVGPAAVEMGGLLVLPRKEDFEKITRQEIAEIYSEVTINETDFEILRNTLKEPSKKKS